MTTPYDNAAIVLLFLRNVSNGARLCFKNGPESLGGGMPEYSEDDSKTIDTVWEHFGLEHGYNDHAKDTLKEIFAGGIP